MSTGAQFEVDEQVCEGHGVCVVEAPTVFELTDEGYAVAADRDLSADEAQLAGFALSACPAMAISRLERA